MKRFRIAAIGVAAVTVFSLLASPAAPAQARTLPRSVAVPMKAINVLPVAVSGPHILVQVGGGTFRLSHDSGKTWKTAKGYCSDLSSDGCAYWSGSEPSEPVGRVLNGVVAHVEVISFHVWELRAYSLRTGSVVGTPYRWTDDERIVDMLGAQVLIAKAGTYTVRSLVDGSTWTVPQSDRYAPNYLLADGSVIATPQGESASMPRQRITWDGSVAAFLPANTHRVVAGSSVAYRPAPGTLCVVSATALTPSCRSGLPTGTDTIAQLSPFGILTAGTRPLWLPISHGRLNAPVPVKLKAPKYPEAHTFQAALSLENAYPVIAQKNSSGTRLLQVKANGKLTVRRLTWARAWDHEDFTSWVVLTSKKVFLSADTIASGTRSATLRNERLTVSDHGTTTGRVKASPDATLLAMSGPQVLLNQNPCAGQGLGDPNPCAVPSEVYRSDGTKLATVEADDIFGDLAVIRDGSRGAGRVVRYQGTQPTVASFTLPDPGQYGSYDGLSLWGDWVAGTFNDGSGSYHAVAYNYRTGQLKLAPNETMLGVLGDGFAVISGHDSTRIWKLVDGTTKSLTWATRVTTDGSRIAYQKSDPDNYLAPARIVAVDLSSLSMTHPRVLGAVAPAKWKKGWKLAIDLTKPVRAGLLEIRNAAGELVRSVKVAASSDGALRNIRWDGRDGSGHKVPAGTYSYRLTSRATDGSGVTQSADGSTGALGSVLVG